MMTTTLPGVLELIDGRDRQTPVYIPRPTAVREPAAREDEVREVVEDIRLRGDAALLTHSERLLGTRASAGELRVAGDTVAKAAQLVRPELIEALEIMAARLHETCTRQKIEGWFEQRGDGVVGELVRPLRRVGIYVASRPVALPSTVINSVVPAQVAGVDGIAVAARPGPGGEIPEAVLAACAVVGVDEVYRIAGAPGIAALAYGTETVRPVDKIVGPGEQDAALAKRLVHGWVGTDADAAPSDIVIVADDAAAPEAIAAELVAEAERTSHGAFVVITWVEDIVERVLTALELRLAAIGADDIENSFIEGGRVVLVRDRDQALQTVNSFAPQRLSLMFAGAFDALDDVKTAEAVYVGASTPVSTARYVCGINDVLPGGALSRWASGLSVHDFMKRIYACGLEAGALPRLARHAQAIARTERIGDRPHTFGWPLDGLGEAGR